MNCSYCGTELPVDERSVPNVFVENKQQRPILALHAECIRSVIEGLQFAERLVVN